MASKSQRGRRTPKRRIILGVNHSTRQLMNAGPVSRYVSNLRRQLVELKKRGITRVGIESALKNLNRTNPLHRYFIAAEIYAKRMGIALVSIEDPIAYEVLNFVKQMDAKISVKDKDWRAKRKEISELRVAANYFRTLKMLENMRRKKLKVGIMGIAHATHFEPSSQEIIYVDPLYHDHGSKERRDRDRALFEKHVKVLTRLYKKAQAKKK